MRRLQAIAVAFVAALTVGLPAVADARPTLTCKASDLRYPFMSGGPKTFGVLRLRITGGTCATARRVARAWGKAFEVASDGTDASLPRSAAGFAFTQLKTTRPQEYRLRGRKGTTSLRFDYRVPNG